MWANRPDVGHLSGVTGFNHAENVSPECRFLDQLDTIDLHHGPYSSELPYTGIRVVGGSATDEIRATLASLGFVIVEANGEEFTATRSQEAAQLIRE